MDSEGLIPQEPPEKPTECLPELSAIYSPAPALQLLTGVLLDGKSDTCQPFVNMDNASSWWTQCQGTGHMLEE